VYLHLSLLQYEIYIGQNEQQEIDFIGIKQGKKVYVQVTYLVIDEKTREREFGNLMNIQDNYPKYVVSLDEFNKGSNVEGIHHLHLADFLKMKQL
jgi:ATPase